MFTKQTNAPIFPTVTRFVYLHSVTREEAVYSICDPSSLNFDEGAIHIHPQILLEYMTPPHTNESLSAGGRVTMLTIQLPQYSGNVKPCKVAQGDLDQVTAMLKATTNKSAG